MKLSRTEREMSEISMNDCGIARDECVGVQVADKASVGELPVSACEHCLASSDA